MAERDPSELELVAAFQAYLADAPTEVRAAELAHELAVAHPRRRIALGRWGLVLTPAVAWALLLTGLLLTGALVGALIAGGLLPPPPVTPLPAIGPAPQGHIYWANRVAAENTKGLTSIGRANVDGTNVNQKFITGANSGVGVVVVGDYIYWASDQDPTIGRAKLDGTEVNQTFISGTGGVVMLASDGTYLYWAGAEDTIGRAKLDGTEMNQTFIGHAGQTTMAVAASGAYIYWTDIWGNAIGRAKLDGTEANSRFISLGEPLAPTDVGNVSSPIGIAISGGNIYWASTLYSYENKIGTGGTIGRAKLDGSGVNRSFIGGDFNPAGIAVAGGYIYWSNPYSGTIGRAKLDGTDVDQSFITGGSMPLGVAIGP